MNETSAAATRRRRYNRRVANLRARWWANGQLAKLNFSHAGKRYNARFEANVGYHVGGMLSITKRPGAGYIGGWTAYLACNSGSRWWQMRYRGRRSWLPFEIGITRNGNRVPYAHS